MLPTYDHLRIYREGDVCRVHFDRSSCERSMSLTLDYRDGDPWSLDVGRVRHPEPDATVEEDFASIAMEVGDAVLYRGTNHRHGRYAQPQWGLRISFCTGPMPTAHTADHAFDGRADGAPVNFSFA